MKHKIVICNSIGGFCLSKEAMVRLINLGYEDEFTIDELDNFKMFFPEIPRHDSRLIQVIEELGERAGGDSRTKLKIVEIEGNLYDIIEHDDGTEYLMTPESHKWIKI